MTGIKGSKVSERLAEEAAGMPPSEVIDVVIGLLRPDEDSESASMSKSDRIAALKAAFEARAESVAERVSSVGGEVLDQAWINSTLRGRVPVAHLDEVADDELVEVVDLQPPLELDEATAAPASEH